MLFARVAVCSLLVLAVSALSCLAENFPSKAIKVIVPYPPGGGADTSTRKIAAVASEKLGQTIVVENRPGASGNIGTAAAAKSKPDGYTVAFLLNTTMCVNPHASANAGFHPLKDFAPITITHQSPGILLVPADSPIRSLADLVRAAKREPGKLLYGSSGIGSPGHLMAERLKRLAGIDLVHVPYKGAAQYLAETAAGRLHATFGFSGPALPYIKAGKLRALAVTSTRRLSALPEVATLQELGVAGYDEVSWSGFGVPAGTPVERVRKLNDAFTAALRTPAVKSYLDANGSELLASTPEQAAALIKADYDRYAKVVKELGLRMD